MSGVFNNAFPTGLTVPLASDVRFGVAVGATTGTCVVPTAANVRSGVAVDVSPGVGTVVVPTAANVRLGVAVDVSGTGNVRVPPAAKVEEGYFYDTLDSVEGTLDVGAGGPYPAIGDVRLGVAYGTTQVGNLRVPAVANVRDGVFFDTLDTLEGTLVLPVQSNVLSGIGYGAAGTELTGVYVGVSQPNVRVGVNYGPSSAFVGLINVPTPSQVLLGVAIDQTTGNVRLPDEDDVRDTVLYGPSDTMEGDLVPGGTSNYPAETEVLDGVVFGDSLELTGNLTLPLEAEVLDGVTFGASGTEFSGNVTLPTEAQVLDPVMFGPGASLQGAVTLPVVANVRFGIAFGVDNLQMGTLNLPSINDVRLGVSYDAATKTGNVRLPDEAEVLAGVDYGSLDSQEGTLDVSGDPPVFPSASNVRLGVTYGTTVNPTLFTGNVRVPPVEQVAAGFAFDTLDSLIGTLVAGSVPPVTDVRFGVIFGEGDSLMGVLELPQESVVLLGVGYGAYGTEFEGTLTDVPGGSGDVFPPVLGSGDLRNPLFIGDAYLAANGRQFEWLLSLPVAPTAAVFRGRQDCAACSDGYDWSSAGVIEDMGDGVWKVTFELPSAATATIPEGEHDWWVVLDDAITAVSSESFGPVDWVCR